VDQLGGQNKVHVPVRASRRVPAVAWATRAEDDLIGRRSGPTATSAASQALAQLRQPLTLDARVGHLDLQLAMRPIARRRGSVASARPSRVPASRFTTGRRQCHPDL
jgi:hypothetical protein